MVEKKKIFFKILWIVLIIGWIGFIAYNFYLWTYILKEYQRDPSNFVFFKDELQREQYKLTKNKIVSDPGYSWVDDVSLMDQCRPMLYFQDLFSEKIQRFIYFTFILILLTLIYRLNPRELEGIKKFINDEREKE